MKQIPSEMFLKQGVLKICSKVTGEQPCRGRISTKLLNCFCSKRKNLGKHGLHKHFCQEKVDNVIS